MARRIIPQAAATRILVDAGAKRVSGKAAEAFSEMIEAYGIGLAAKAAALAKHAGRKTLFAEDVKVSRA